MPASGLWKNLASVLRTYFCRTAVGADSREKGINGQVLRLSFPAIAHSSATLRYRRAVLSPRRSNFETARTEP
jgi:hypothetical protein